MTTTDRCATAHPKDTTPCEGPRDAVSLVHKVGTETLGCVHHAARMYASLVDPHVYPGRDDHEAGAAAIEVYYRALDILPFPWLTEKAESGDLS